jgi:hypothetical protein
MKMISMITKCYFIYIFPAGITSFNAANVSSNFVKIAKGGTTTVHLVYETPDVASTYSLSAVISAGTTLNTRDASINDNNKTITFMVDSSSINSLHYGVYTLNLNLTQRKHNYFIDVISKELILYYEEAITTIQVNTVHLKYMASASYKYWYIYKYLI